MESQAQDLHVFRNSKAGVWGFTAEASGSALPHDYPEKGDKWYSWKKFEPGKSGRIGFSLSKEEDVLKEIGERGYFIEHVEPRILRKAP